MSLFQRVLGNPFVYNYVRPLAVGGIDMSPLYARLAADEASVLLDIGCGTGDALRYIPSFRQYSGFDTDPIAVDFARSRYGDNPKVSFESRHLMPEDVDRISPTHVLLASVLHHLTDEEAVGVLGSVRRSTRLSRLVTSDIVYLPGKWVNNLLAAMDRGPYCRTQDAYRELAKRGGFSVAESAVVQSRPVTGLAWYFMMTLVPS